MKHIGIILSGILCTTLVALLNNSMVPNECVEKANAESLFSKPSHTYYIKKVIDLHAGC